MLPRPPTLAEKLRGWETRTDPPPLTDNTAIQPTEPDHTPDWNRYPDDHPGWDRLLDGMARIVRIHGVDGHQCSMCDGLRAGIRREAA